MDMMVASNREAIMMVEAGSNEVSEEVVLEDLALAAAITVRETQEESGVAFPASD